MVVCPGCGRESNAENKICPYCGSVLADGNEYVATRAFEDTDFEEGRLQWGTAHFGQQMHLVIQLRDSRERFMLELSDGDELTIGRLDPETGGVPDVDLSKFDAIDKGVSRRHAMITRSDTSLNVIDLGAANGSYLNGQRLMPNQARVLRDGDELRLGHMVLLVAFMRH